MMDIMEMTAVELGMKIKARELSAVEAAKAALARAEEREREIHSFLSIDGEGALKRAGEVQKQIEDGTLTGPLAGVPAGIKDNICTCGMKTTCASKILEHYIPSYTAEAVQKLEESGAVVIGKTNMDEFAMGSTTET